MPSLIQDYLDQAGNTAFTLQRRSHLRTFTWKWAVLYAVQRRI